MTAAESLVAQAKMLAYREIYLELLKDERIPYDVCVKVKEKITTLETSFDVPSYAQIS